MNCGAVFEICNGGSEAGFGEAITMEPIFGLCDTEEETLCHLKNMKESSQNRSLN